MFCSIIRRGISKLLLIIVACMLLTVSAFAHTPATNVEVSVSNAISNSMSTDGAITVTAKGSAGFFGFGASAKTATITIKNNSEVTASISFNWTATSVHQLTIAGKTVTDTAGSYTKKDLGAGSSFTVMITTDADSTVNTLVLSNFVWVDQSATSSITMDYDDGLGVVTIDGETVATGSSKTVSAEATLVATPTAEGATFIGWTDVSTGKLLSTKSEYKKLIEEDMSIRAEFEEEGKAWFLADGKLHNNLTNAVTTANSATDKTVLPVNDGVLPSGDYTIPSGIALLIPYNDANTLITNNAEDYLIDAYGTLDSSNHYSATRTLYRKLTMESGTKITVASGGVISINSQTANQFIGQKGDYGAVYMNEGSNITVKSGGFLYVWGYIFYGDETGGTVTVESGGTVYEPLSTMDYPGSASLTSDLNDEKVFPMRAYTVRNVEVPMTLNYGATEYVFYCLWGNSIGTHPGYVLMINHQSVDGETPVFQMASGCVFTKCYVDGVQYMTCSGSVSLNSMSVTISVKLGLLTTTKTVSSSDTSGFYLPSGWDISIENGTATLNDNIIVAEGSVFRVAHGATIDTNGKSVYIFDTDDDVGAVYQINGCNIYVHDVHGRYYTRVETDAVLDVNGKVIASGGFYTSTNKASIISSEGTGVIEISGTASETSIKAKDNSNSYQTVSITAAYLQNGDGTYVASTTDTYTYCKTCGTWLDPASETVYAASIIDDDGLTTGSYHTLQGAANSYDGTGHIQMLADSTTRPCTIEEDQTVSLDLNGKTVKEVTLSGTLKGADSATDDYGLSGAVYGTLTLAETSNVPTVSNVNGKDYVTYYDGTAYSFHRVAVAPVAYQYYYNDSEKAHSHMAIQAAFLGDAIATGLVQDIGFAITADSVTDPTGVAVPEGIQWYGSAPGFVITAGQELFSFVALDYKGTTGFANTYTATAYVAFGNKTEAERISRAASYPVSFDMALELGVKETQEG